MFHILQWFRKQCKKDNGQKNIVTFMFLSGIIHYCILIFLQLAGVYSVLMQILLYNRQKTIDKYILVS